MACTTLTVERHDIRLAADVDIVALKGRLVQPGDHVTVRTTPDVEADPDAWSDLVIAVDLEDWAR
jgi:hypothetical protein